MKASLVALLLCSSCSGLQSEVQANPISNEVVVLDTASFEADSLIAQRLAIIKEMKRRAEKLVTSGSEYDVAYTGLLEWGHRVNLTNVYIVYAVTPEKGVFFYVAEDPGRDGFGPVTLGGKYQVCRSTVDFASLGKKELPSLGFVGLPSGKCSEWPPAPFGDNMSSEAAYELWKAEHSELQYTIHDRHEVGDFEIVRVTSKPGGSSPVDAFTVAETVLKLENSQWSHALPIDNRWADGAVIFADDGEMLFVRKGRWHDEYCVVRNLEWNELVSGRTQFGEIDTACENLPDIRADEPPPVIYTRPVEDLPR